MASAPKLAPSINPLSEVSITPTAIASYGAPAGPSAQSPAMG
jgi:hypothetical protein